MGEVTKNFIEDKSNEDLVSSGVFDKINGDEKTLDQANETAINKKVEDSFQEFLKINGDKKTQEKFNEWLDGDVTRILDRSKIEEIRKINNGIENSLKNLNFSIELSAFQQLIQESNRENDAQETTVYSGEKEQTNLEKKLNDNITIETLIRSKVSDEQLQQLFKSINKTNFKERDFVIDCLNKGKREDIRKIQYLLIGKKDEYEIGKSGNKIGTLKKYGTDGLFGKETFDALINYIEDKNNKIEPVPQEIDNNESQNISDKSSKVLDSDNDGSSGDNKQSDAEQLTADESKGNRSIISGDGDTFTTKNLVTNKKKDQDGQPEQSQDPGQGEGNQPAGDGTADVQLQYEGIGYNVDNPELQVSSDEDAIKYLTTGKNVFFVAKWFGKRRHNSELSIVDNQYIPIGPEQKELKNLNKLLLECKDNPAEVFTKIFKNDKNFGDNKNLIELYDLYWDCKNDQNGTKKGSYLKKVMGLLENYFVRGVNDKNGNKITTFKDMYNNELLGIKKDLEKKERKAKKKLSNDDESSLRESGGTAVEAENTKKQLELPSEKFAEFKEKYGFDSNAETQFAMCLCDLNADGRIDSADMNAKTGQELFNMIKDAKVDQKYGILKKGPMYNILNFAKIKAEQDGHANTAEFLKGIDLNGTDEEIMNKLKKRPLTIQYLRYMLINSPMNMANNIIRYGGVRVETENTGDDLNLDKDTREAINKIMSDEKFEEIYGNAYQQLIEQGLNDTPEIKKKLRPIIALALFESSGSYMGGISGGFDLSLGNAGDIAFMLGAGVGPDGNLMAGVTAAYGKSWNVGKYKDNILSIGGSVGVNFAEGQCIPVIMGSLGFDQVINRKKLQNTLEERSKKYLGIDANGGVIIAGPVPVWGVGLSFSQDKMKGLNTTYESIKGNLGNALKEVLKDQWPNSTDKAEIRTKMIASIKTALESRYGMTNEQELDQAAQNIFGGISYYLTEIENPSQITTAIIEKVAENYANQWRNHAMSELNGTTELERVRVGLEFLSGYWPIPMASMSFKKYGNLTANETQESMENYYKRLSSGMGMNYIENSVNKQGYLTDNIIGYLNDKLGVVFPSSNIPELQMKIEGFRMEDGNTINTINVLKIPRNLCKYANICHSPELKRYIQYDHNSDCFIVPTNIKVGLLTYSRTNEGKYNLILGDSKKGSDFVDLNINSTPIGNPLKYEGKQKGEARITESMINGNEEMKKLFDNPEFPLSRCVAINDGKISFKQKDGFNINISGEISLNNGLFVVPEYGILQIKKSNGVYSATFDNGQKDKLTVTYVDVEKYEEYMENSKSEINLTNSEIFDKYKELNGMFGNIEKRLSKLDDNQRGNYASFMDYASDMADGILDEQDYKGAFDKLKNMLSSLSAEDLKDTELFNLKQTVDNGGQMTIEEKTLIVDRFKMLFSYHIDLTDGQNDGVDLVRTIARRGNVYETLKGYNGQCIPGIHGYRERILEQLENKTSLSKNVFPNLVGMTAFYRYNKYGKKITQGRGYSMTEMGKTTVLGGCYEELNDENLKNWFIENLDKSNIHKSILRENLIKKVQSISGCESATIDNEQMIKLLKGEELDILGKKLKLEVKYMFYLLGECGNESVGVNLEKIIVRGLVDGGGEGGGQGETGESSVDINPKPSYEDSAGVSIDGVYAENKLNIGIARSQTYGIAFGSERSKEPGDNPGSHPGNGDGQEPGDNPGSGPGIGDNEGDNGSVGGDNNGLD